MIIVIEGVDQAGKQTQALKLVSALENEGKTVRMFDFPDYETVVGEVIRNMLNSGKPIVPQVLHCLLAANRWEVASDIRRSKHDILVMNRYTQSNLVYGLVNGMSREWLANLDDGIPKADIVVVLDIPVEESFRRKTNTRDVFEADMGFMKRVRETYLGLAEKRGWHVMDATGTIDYVHDEIMKFLGSKMK